MRRISLFLIPGLIAIAIFFSLSTFETLTSPPGPEDPLRELDYDGYSEGINTVLYDTLGNINYTLQADKQIHFNDDRTELEKPFIRLFEGGNSRWNIVADSGRISSLYEADDTHVQLIELSGSIEIYGLDELGNRMQLTTEYLKVNPQTRTLDTNDPVTLVTNNLQLTSIGMFADLQQDEVTFKRETKGHYEFSIQ